MFESLFIIIGISNIIYCIWCVIEYLKSVLLTISVIFTVNTRRSSWVNPAGTGNFLIFARRI